MNYSDLTDVSVKFAVMMEGCATAVVTLTSLFPVAIMGTLPVKLNLEVFRILCSVIEEEFQSLLLYIPQSALPDQRHVSVSVLLLL